MTFGIASHPSYLMASKKVEFHDEANLELGAAFDWYLERSEPAAARFIAEMDEAIAIISQAPKRSPESGFGTSFCSDFRLLSSIESFLCPYKSLLWLTGTAVQAIGKIDFEERPLRPL
jgi:plasmid stabilization system protein ParE